MCWFSSWDTVFGYSNVSSCMLLSHVVVQWLETGFEALCPTFEERSWRVGIDRPNIFLFLMTYVLNSFSLYMLYGSNSHSHLKRLPWVAFPHRGPLSSSNGGLCTWAKDVWTFAITTATKVSTASEECPLDPLKVRAKMSSFFLSHKRDPTILPLKSITEPLKINVSGQIISTSQKTSPQNVANWKGNGTPAISEKSRLVKYCSIWPDGDVLDEKKIILL